MTFSNSLKELEKLHTHLQIMNKSLGDDEWLARKTEVENKKVVVKNKCSNFVAETFTAEFLFLLPSIRCFGRINIFITAAIYCLTIF